MSSVKSIFNEGSKDPYARLLQQLVGDLGAKPSKPAAFNLWQKTKMDSKYINRITKERMAQEGLPKRFRAATRSAVVHEIFDQKCANEPHFKDEWEAKSVARMECTYRRMEI